MRRLRRLGLWLLVLLVILAMPALYIAAECRGDAATATAASQVLPPEIRARLDAIPDYRFAEENSYLTFPEWYIVYTSQDYADHIAKERPSGFRFFTSAGEFWTSYCGVNRFVSARYPFNFDTHLTIYVIGVSHSAEYALKGLYENTIGRVSEWMAPPLPTDEEVFARQFARDYGQWLNTVPWYEYPFRDRLAELWVVPLWGRGAFRKIERRIALTAELGVKSAYGWLIKGGTRSAYEPAQLEIRAVLQAVAVDLAAIDPRLKIEQDFGKGVVLAVIPRYQPFTEIVLKLTTTNARFLEIGGNDEILVSLRVPAGWEAPASLPPPLFDIEVLMPGGGRRIGMSVPVASLIETVKAAMAQGATLEHVYDY